MLYLYQSNQLETLSSALNKILGKPLGDPLQAETIVVQHPGMERWLSQQIARQTGIAANLSFPLPANFIWEFLELSLGETIDTSLFKRDVLIWRILNELDDLPASPSSWEVNHYLSEDEDGSKHFGLAGKVAGLFDQYLVYRPEKILAWEQGEARNWQAELWRKLSADENSMHWARLLKRFHLASKQNRLKKEHLPERICFFGIDALAPDYLKVIEIISNLTEVHLLHFSPCEEAWDDIVSNREQALKRQKTTSPLDEETAHFTAGNPLLASMGRTGREFFSLLMELEPGNEQDLYIAPNQGTLLGAIQADIQTLHDRGNSAEKAPLPNDHSIRFHSCHSPLREVQVLHDRLLDLFTADPKLNPEDVLVMAPDINTYAPYIPGVFGSPRDGLHLPWSIADLSGRAQHPAIEAFIGLLELSSSRFTAAEVMALLEMRPVRAKFKLDKQAISTIRANIPDTGIRWGLDIKQRTQLGVDRTGTHTWAFGIDRLLLGYMTGPLDTLLTDIMPFDGMLTGAEEWLGSLSTFVHALQSLQDALRDNHSPEKWCHIFEKILKEFFDGAENSPDLEGLTNLRKTIECFRLDCDLATYTTPLSLNLVRQHFLKILGSAGVNQAFLTGKISFCSLSPMRTIPAKVICLLGMNDTAYPHSQRPAEFDLIATEPKLGDRNQREADRYLFLETLLQARDHLHISWVGQNQQSNEKQPPSVLVAELSDYIDRSWQHPKEAQKKSSVFLVAQHPLQPFSRKCFDGEKPELASYAGIWLSSTDAPGDLRFISKPLEPISDEPPHVDLAELIRFWGHPVRYFLQQRLGLKLWGEDESLAESEVFALNALQEYLLGDAITSAQLEGKSEDTFFFRMQAAAELPRGELGRVYSEEVLYTSHTLMNALQPLTEKPREQVKICLQVSEMHLKGWLRGLYETGRVSYRMAKCKPKDLLQLWIHHLVLLLSSPEGVTPVSIHVATDKISHFGAVENPHSELEKLVQYYHLGLTTPLHFYPKTSFAWAKSPSSAMNAARKAWYVDLYNRFAEEEDQANQIALRGVEDPLDGKFEELAALFYPLLNHLEQHDAGA